jgi:hypothetical protein
MSYWNISVMALDNDLTRREAAAAAQENAPGDANQWALDHGLQLASSPGWDAAYSSALAGGVENPGRDEAVITDGMILSAVQSVLGAP